MFVKGLIGLLVIFVTTFVSADEAYDKLRYTLEGRYIEFSFDETTWAPEGYFIDYPKRIEAVRVFREYGSTEVVTNKANLELRLSPNRKEYVYRETKPVYVRKTEGYTIKRYLAYDAEDVLPTPKDFLYEFTIEVRVYTDGRIHERILKSEKSQQRYDFSSKSSKQSCGFRKL